MSAYFPKIFQINFSILQERLISNMKFKKKLIHPSKTIKTHIFVKFFDI